MKDKTLQTHAIRLAEHVRTPPMPPAAVLISGAAPGLCFLDPKQALQALHQVRIANAVVEVRRAGRLQLFLPNFSKSPRRLPKGTVIGFADRNPMSIVTPDRDVGEQCGKVLNLTPLPALPSQEFEVKNPWWNDPSADTQVGGVTQCGTAHARKATRPSGLFGHLSPYYLRGVG